MINDDIFGPVYKPSDEIFNRRKYILTKKDADADVGGDDDNLVGVLWQVVELRVEAVVSEYCESCYVA